MVKFIIVPMQKSSLLKGKENGKLPLSILTTVPGQDGGANVTLVKPAARCWVALCAEAKKHGHILKTSAPNSSYRPYEDQLRIFLQRYKREYKANTDVKWWKQPGQILRRKWYKWFGAIAAAPGTSNHGWASAVDAGEERDGDSAPESFDDPTLMWLHNNMRRYGFSHELQPEPWHLRYFSGDKIPQAVLDYEQQNLPTKPPVLTKKGQGTVCIFSVTDSGRNYLIMPEGPVAITPEFATKLIYGVGCSPMPVYKMTLAEYHLCYP